jgi:MFS family permease
MYQISGSSTMSYFSLYIQSLGGTKQIIALSMVLAAVVEIPFMIWVGRASDRIGRRPPLVIAFLTLPLRLFLYARLGSPMDVFYIQLFHGLTFSFMLVASMAFVADLSAGDRATGQGLLSMSNAIAMAAGPFIAGMVADRTSLPAMYGAFSMVALIGGLVFILFVRESHPELADVPHPAGGSLIARPIRRILRAPVIDR